MNICYVWTENIVLCVAAHSHVLMWNDWKFVIKTCRIYSYCVSFPLHNTCMYVQKINRSSSNVGACNWAKAKPSLFFLVTISKMKPEKEFQDVLCKECKFTPCIWEQHGLSIVDQCKIILHAQKPSARNSQYRKMCYQFLMNITAFPFQICILHFYWWRLCWERRV